ncbi:MAG: response regulator [Deltaproteobacteria bacterium]|nr:MAG: response regulator [Deltaproteobacteria bacterium]
MTRRPRVLVIEDDDVFRELEIHYLGRRGYELSGAASGEVGLELFEREEFDVILCDLRLPGIDGLEVLAAVTERAPELPVIVVSGASALDDAIQALKRGAWDFVTKPMESLSLLDRALKQALERADLLRQNRVYRERLENLNRQLQGALAQLRADAEAGRALQQKLLPDNAQRIAGWRLSRRLWPSTYLSGDFVDYFRIDARHVGLYIVDVAGHGAASAILTVMLKTLVTQYREAYERDGDETILLPHRTLARLDHDLRQLRLPNHVTAVFGVLDLETRQLTLSGAGHYPYPLVRENGAWRTEMCPGRPLGLFEGNTYAPHTVSLGPGAAVLMASDGVLEVIEGDSLDAKVERLGRAFCVGDDDLERLAARFGLDDARALPDDAALLLLHEEDP